MFFFVKITFHFCNVIKFDIRKWSIYCSNTRESLDELRKCSFFNDLICSFLTKSLISLMSAWDPFSRFYLYFYILGEGCSTGALRQRALVISEDVTPQLKDNRISKIYTTFTFIYARLLQYIGVLF